MSCVRLLGEVACDHCRPQPTPDADRMSERTPSNRRTSAVDARSEAADSFTSDDYDQMLRQGE